ncbi:MAG: hypothetical protein AAGI38_05785 [Bacteroidota bacterium]
MKSLESHLNDFYEGINLESGELSEVKGSRPPETPNWLPFLNAAAVISIIGLTVLGFYLQLKPQPWQQFAEEIAWNHEKGLETEFETQSYGVLQKDMQRLDFSLIRPKKMRKDLQLAGGRYCSVDKCIAAQLRLHDPTGNPYTLYQFKHPKTEALSGLVTFHLPTGTDVTLWREGEVIMGLAQDKKRL